MKTLILGLGNPILKDDSVGLRVVQNLYAVLPENSDVDIDEDYWGGLRLMERMIGYDRAVIVDAILTGVKPGTIHVLSPEDVPTQRSASAHDVNLPTALALGRQAGAHLPDSDDILLVGIEAADVQTFDEELSPEVEAALPDAVNAVLYALEMERETMISPEVFRRYPHFAGIEDACLRELGKLSEERSFKANEEIFSESGAFIATSRIYEKGEEASHLMLLTEGRVDVLLTLGTGERVVVGTLVAGDLMALSALIPPYHLTASGLAKEDGKLIQFKAKALRELLEENTGLGYRLMQGVAKGLMTRLQDTRVELAGESYAS